MAGSVEMKVFGKCDCCGCPGVDVDADVDAGVPIDVSTDMGLIQIYFDRVEGDDNDNERTYLCESCHADLRGPDLSKWWLLK